MGAELEAVQADADASPDGVTVPLVTEAGEFPVTIPPPGRWKSRANTALRVGDFTTWAQLVLSEDDFESWSEGDPTNDEVEDFFRAWKKTSGEDPKGSGRSPRSSRSTARR